MRNVLLFIVLLAATVVSAGAELSAERKDIEGSKDHALIARYPGAVISRYETHKKGDYLLPVGKLKGEAAGKTQKLSGSVTRITYEGREDQSPEDIYHSYRRQIQERGFELLFSTGGASLSPRSVWCDVFYPDQYYLQGETRDQYFISACRENHYVAVYVSRGWYRYPVIQEDVIEVKPTKAGVLRK